MRYGRIINGGCLVRESPADGYKPIMETTPEARPDYRAVYHYEDNGETIISVWEYVELTDEEKAEAEAHGIDEAEALSIILGDN